MNDVEPGPGPDRLHWVLPGHSDRCRSCPPHFWRVLPRPGVTSQGRLRPAGRCREHWSGRVGAEWAMRIVAAGRGPHVVAVPRRGPPVNAPAPGVRPDPSGVVVCPRPRDGVRLAGARMAFVDHGARRERLGGRVVAPGAGDVVVRRFAPGRADCDLGHRWGGRNVGAAWTRCCVDLIGGAGPFVNLAASLAWGDRIVMARSGDLVLLESFGRGADRDPCRGRTGWNVVVARGGVCVGAIWRAVIRHKYLAALLTVPETGKCLVVSWRRSPLLGSLRQPRTDVDRDGLRAESLLRFIRRWARIQTPTTRRSDVNRNSLQCGRVSDWENRHCEWRWSFSSQFY